MMNKYKYKHLHKNTSRPVDLDENTDCNVYISNYTKMLISLEYYKEHYQKAHIIIPNSVFLLTFNTKEHIILPNSIKYINIYFDRKNNILNKNLYIGSYCSTSNHRLTTISNIIYAHTLNYIKNIKNNFLIENICNIKITEKYKSYFLLYKNTKTVEIIKKILNILIFRHIFNLTINNCENLNLKYVKNVFNLSTCFCFFKNTNNILMNNFKYEYYIGLANTKMSVHDGIMFTNIYKLKLFYIDAHCVEYLSIVCHSWIILIRLDSSYNFNNQKKITFKYTNKITLYCSNILIPNFQVTHNNHTCILYKYEYSNYHLICKYLHTLKLYNCNLNINNIVNAQINNLHSLTMYNVGYKITQMIKNISMLHINEKQLSYANKHLKTINGIKTVNCNECDIY